MWVRRRHRPRPSDATEAVSDHVPTGVTPGAAKAPSRRYISWAVLAMMTVGSVGYLGSTPATSVFGLASVFLYVLPAIAFLVPVSLVAAELASGWEGGVYNWVREGVSACLLYTSPSPRDRQKSR